MNLETLLRERKKTFRPEHGAYVAHIDTDGTVRLSHHKEPDIHFPDESHLSDFCAEKGISEHGPIGLIVVEYCSPEPDPIEL